MHVNITSAAGIIALLEETDERLVVYALKQLNSLVDMFWAEIADSITTMFVFYSINFSLIYLILINLLI